MKIILKFNNGILKEKEIPESKLPPKIMFHGDMDPELHKYLSMSPNAGDQMAKMAGGIMFELSSEPPIYVEMGQEAPKNNR